MALRRGSQEGWGDDVSEPRGRTAISAVRTQKVAVGCGEDGVLGWGDGGGEALSGAYNDFTARGPNPLIL